MAINNYAQSWTDVYEKYQSVVNFVAGDFDSLKDVIRRYIASQNPENYNDWAESSEVGMFSNGLSYLGESIHYRVDLNAHDVFPSTTERRQSLLDFTKMLSYSPKRNICATGIAKIKSITTSQNITDTSGNILKDTPILWNDASNPDWLEQFLTVMNASFVSNNPYGKPLKRESVDNITTQLYQMNTTTISNTVFSFTSQVNATTQQFEVVNPDINTDLAQIEERTPIPEQAFHLLYRNDGTGNGSNNTGFFVYWKQGTLQYENQVISQKVENYFIDVNKDNINEYDVWFEELDISTGLVKNVWTKIANNEYLVYNNTDTTIRDIFKVETRENDRITLRFSDGKFGTIPVGVFKLWYRVSNGNDNLYLKPTDIQDVTIKIPYKSNNTSDDNIYYLTVVFSITDASHIRQSVTQESMEYIRERAPQVYSTQNRMVTAQDYNYFPKSIGQQVKVLKAINRTYSGNSRYINFNDPTGTYQDLNILAEDGYVYKQDVLYMTETSIEDTTNTTQIINMIETLLSSNSLNNFFYSYYPENSNSYSSKEIFWNETYTTGLNSSVGRFMVDISEESLATGVVVPKSEILKQMQVGYMIKFQADGYDGEIWAKILDIVTSDESEEEYSITINEVLDPNYKWYAKGGYRVFSTILNAQARYEISNKIEDKVSFGLSYDYINQRWDVLDYETLADDSISFDYENPYTESGLYKNWIMKIRYESSQYWTYTIRYLDYIFGSDKKVAFFFNTNDKSDDNASFVTSDYIKVLKTNSNNNKNLAEDYFWKPIETIKYPDGYTDPYQFKVSSYDLDKDSSSENPRQFSEITSIGEKNLFFLKTSDEYGSFNSSVQEIDSLWGHTTESSLYYCQTGGTIFPAGTILPVSVTVSKKVKLSNGVTYEWTPSNPFTFNKGEKYDVDVVYDGHEVEWTTDIEGNTTLVSDIEIGSQLVYWNSMYKTMDRYSDDSYYIRTGIDNLLFLWKHYASSSYVIDPCPTNIMDMFVLTNTYYESVQEWLSNGKKGTFPKLPSAYELKSLFAELENYCMVSDTMVWHPISYKVLFGNESDNEYKANFRVIKNETTTMSDNEIKQQVIQAIDEFFATMEAGEKFFFTQLSTYIHQKLQQNIGTVVIVPTYSNDKFGNLFEIECEEDEILLSSASIDDVQIITKITEHNIRIGE